MFRALAALGATFVTFAAGASAVAQSTPFFVAVPATPPSRTTPMTRETIWHSSGVAYVTQRQPERAAILCELVVRSAGPLTSFTVGGQPFDADRLARCNAAAR